MRPPGPRERADRRHFTMTSTATSATSPPTAAPFTRSAHTGSIWAPCRAFWAQGAWMWPTLRRPTSTRSLTLMAVLFISTIAIDDPCANGKTHELTRIATPQSSQNTTKQHGRAVFSNEKWRRARLHSMCSTSYPFLARYSAMIERWHLSGSFSAHMRQKG